MNRRTLEHTRNFVLVVGALAFTGVVASVGCSRSETNVGTALAASNPAMKTVTIPIEGMSCVACAASVKKTLKEIPGVQAVELNLEHRNAQVRYVDGQVSPERFVNAINQLGYKAGSPSVKASQPVAEPQ